MSEPALITKNLIERIECLTANPEGINDIAVGRIRKDIENLQRVAMVDGIMAQGMLDSALLKKVDAVKHFDQAMKISGHDQVVAKNYVIALIRLGLFRQAYQVLSELPDKHDPFYKDNALHIGKYSAGLTAAENDPSGYEIATTAQKLGLDDRQTMGILALAASHLVQHGYAVRGTRVLGLEGRIVHFLLSNADAQKMADLEYSLAESIVDNGFDISGFTVCYSGMKSWESERKIF